MNSRYRKFIKTGLITPLIIGVILSAVFFLIFSQMYKTFPFYNRSISISNYETEEVKTVEDFVTGGELRKSEMPALSKNTIIGNISFNNTDAEIIFDANEYNGSDRINISDDSVLFGQAGGTVLSANKLFFNDIKALKTGDVITVNSFYGEYKYKVLSTTAFNTVNDIQKADDSLSRSLIVYTDKESTPGISQGYYAVIGEMVSGTPVAE